MGNQTLLDHLDSLQNVDAKGHQYHKKTGTLDKIQNDLDDKKKKKFFNATFF
jgi:uncharacterized protein YaaN involved in tellurite resistance